MFRYFDFSKSRADKVRAIFFRYLKSYRTFIDLAEQRAIKVSPETMRASQVAFQLQRLLNARQSMRFEHLFAISKFKSNELRTLSSIEVRIESGWSDAEEAELLQNHPSYKGTALEIQHLRAAMDSAALAKRREVLELDSEYCTARLALAERARKLINQMPK